MTNLSYLVYFFFDDDNDDSKIHEVKTQLFPDCFSKTGLKKRFSHGEIS